MSAWKCNKCNAEVEETTEIKIHFNDLELPDATGYRCPVCGKEWVDPEYAVTDLASVDSMLEGK